MIRLENLSVRAGSFELHDLNLEIPAGRYAMLTGRTGSGKTTILEAICGLKQIESGAIYLNDRNVTHLPPAVRGVGFVPQEGALFPEMSIADQIGFSLKLRKRPVVEIQTRTKELARLMAIEHLLNRYPEGLSGGEAQRVALARAMAFDPSVLCLDEPLSALDDQTREEIVALLQTIKQTAGVTILHITHNQRDVDDLADLTIRLENGQFVFL